MPFRRCNAKSPPHYVGIISSAGRSTQVEDLIHDASLPLSTQSRWSDHSAQVRPSIYLLTNRVAFSLSCSKQQQPPCCYMESINQIQPQACHPTILQVERSDRWRQSASFVPSRARASWQRMIRTPTSLANGADCCS